MNSNDRGHSEIDHNAIDFTRLVISNASADSMPFSFSVMGDTDAGIAKGNLSGEFSSTFAKEILQCSFPDDSLATENTVDINQKRDASISNSLLLHTGDVTYPIGSYRNYLTGFLRPYRSLLSQIPENPLYESSDVVFRQPFLPVPGNHDYGEHRHHIFWRMVLRKICDGLRRIGIDFAYYGGEGGEAYQKTFLDDLSRLDASQLRQHLVNYYSASVCNASTEENTSTKENASDKEPSQYCLNYCPGEFTRLPNRYYQYRYGGVDFFALDSNTWNTSPDANGFDHGQLDWLERSLIQSWRADLENGDKAQKTIARIVYLHHSPYTTEESRWQQPEALWVRRHLRAVLDRVALSLDRTYPVSSDQKRSPLINLVLSGHAHCLEHVKTEDTGHADSHIDWIVCGGSGADIRRQRQAGPDILERISKGERSRTSVVATSRLYAGVHGHGQKRQKFHSFIKVQIHPQHERKITVHPFLIFRQSNRLQSKALAPIEIALRKRCSPLKTTEKVAS